jgi:hypothetical protein
MPPSTITNLPTISITAPQTETNFTVTNFRRLSSYLRNHLNPLRPHLCWLSALFRRTAVPQVSAKEYRKHWYSLCILGHFCLVATMIFGFCTVHAPSSSIPRLFTKCMKISLRNRSSDSDKLTPQKTLNIITTSLLATFLVTAYLTHTSYEIRRCYCVHFLRSSSPNLASSIMFAWGCADMWFVGVMGWVVWKYGFALPWWGYLLVTGVVYAWCGVVWLDRNRSRVERGRMRDRRLDVGDARRGRDIGWRTGSVWWM